MRTVTLMSLAGIAMLALGRPETCQTCELNTGIPPSSTVITLSASTCTVGTSLPFTLRATDTDNDDLVYSYTIWNAAGSLLQFGPQIGPVPSGTTVSASHTFTATGDFRIQAQAVDLHGNRGPYSSKWVKVVAKSGGKGSPATEKVRDGSAP
jgi:hypothetical protein